MNLLAVNALGIVGQASMGVALFAQAESAPNTVMAAFIGIAIGSQGLQGWLIKKLFDSLGDQRAGFLQALREQAADSKARREATDSRTDKLLGAVVTVAGNGRGKSRPQEL